MAEERLWTEIYTLRHTHEHRDSAISSTPHFTGACFFDFQGSIIFVAAGKVTKRVPGTFPLYFFFFASSKKIIVAEKDKAPIKIV